MGSIIQRIAFPVLNYITWKTLKRHGQPTKRHHNVLLTRQKFGVNLVWPFPPVVSQFVTLKHLPDLFTLLASCLLVISWLKAPEIEVGREFLLRKYSKHAYVCARSMSWGCTFLKKINYISKLGKTSCKLRTPKPPQLDQRPRSPSPPLQPKIWYHPNILLNSSLNG